MHDHRDLEVASAILRTKLGRSLLAKGGLLKKNDICGLADALDRLRVETAYETWDLTDVRTVTLSLVRTGCIRLAAALRDRGSVQSNAVGSWIACTTSDPIPEVRYALESSEDKEAEL